MKRLLFVALISALALAQDKRTEAEELFEKAWWEETASGALDKALEGYRKAADAAGPAAIGARSLYRAAIVEQRLGRTDAAVALLERLAKDFAGETELLKEAKARLQEWTAVDLRKSFSEWYRSYVYSPEFQARVVDLVLRLGTAKPDEEQEVRGQLLTIGEASVPALQEALKSSNQRLCHAVTELLLELGIVPPTDALIRYPAWVRNGDARWLVIYSADEATRKRVREEAKGDEPLARALRAVTTSPEEMFSFAVSCSGYPAQYALSLLYRQSGDAMRKRLEALILEPAVPDHIVSYLRSALPQGPEDADMARCLEWTRSLPTRPAREAAATWAVRRLTEKSEADLDAVLSLVTEDGVLSDLAVLVLDTLCSNRHVAALAWTPARIGPLLDVFFKLEATGKPVLNYTSEDPVQEGLRALHGLVVALPNEERGAAALADALLDRAARVRSSWLVGMTQTQRVLITALGQKQWQDYLCERMAARWPGASREDKIALLDIAAKSSFHAALRKMLGDALPKDAVARTTDPELQVAIVALLGRIQVRDLLAAFDLSKADDAQAAVDTLARLSKHLTRDDGTVASMGEILIPSSSTARRRALQLLREWGSENSGALLPAAKILVRDEHAEVRLWAVNRLSEWNSFDASPFLVKALADTDADIRAAAAGGLARVGREDAVPALIKLLDDANPAVREAALGALEQIRKIVEQKKAWQLEQAGFR
jgi:HEAT repeat protein